MSTAKGKGASAFVKGQRAPTERMHRAAKLIVENGGKEVPLSKGEIMKEAGYGSAIQQTPNKITRSEAFQALLEQYMPDDDLATVHKRLLQTRKLEHMVFPLEHQDPSDIGRPVPVVGEMREKEIHERRIIDNMSDEDIIDMLAEVSCKVKRIVHGETARHVYYWAHDANAQTKALDLAYKMKGYVGAGSGDDKGGVNFNLNFGTQNFVKKMENKS